MNNVVQSYTYGVDPVSIMQYLPKLIKLQSLSTHIDHISVYAVTVEFTFASLLSLTTNRFHCCSLDVIPLICVHVLSTILVTFHLLMVILPLSILQFLI